MAIAARLTSHAFLASFISCAFALGAVAACGDDGPDPSATSTANGVGGMAQGGAATGGDGGSGAEGGQVSGGGGEGGEGGGGLVCDDGFELVDGMCEDIDECAVATHDCIADVNCENLPGTFGCRCPAGEIGDARADGAGCIDRVGLLLWLDGADPLDNHVPPADGEAIDVWHDRSGNGHHAVQNVVPRRPTFAADAANGRGVVRFDGQSALDPDALDIPNGDGAFDLEFAHVFIVAKRNFVTTQPAAPGLFAVRSGDPTRISLHWGAAGDNFLSWNGSQFAAAPVALPETSYHLFHAAWYLSGEIPLADLRVNDEALIQNSAPPWNQSETLHDVRIGWSGHDSEHFDGDIAEVVVYHSGAVPAGFQAVVAYLSQKWGLGL